MDISQEKTRTYFLPSGDRIVIDNPVRVGIKRVQFGESYVDSHVVWNKEGSGCYISSFEAITWTGYDATDETFGDRLNKALETGAEEA